MTSLLLALSLLGCGEGKEPAETTTTAPVDPLAAPADVAAPPADAQKSASGLAWKVLTPGTGADHPAAWDMVTVHYTGWTTDGNRFDSSVARGEPTSFALNQVIAGWTEGLQLMTVGEKRRFWIPVELAYQNRPGKPAGMLVFDVELLKIDKKPAPPPAPEDVAAPPADAEKSKSGLAWRVLQPGTGKDHPKATDIVTFHYSGWTTDGKLFDSSILAEKPLKLPLERFLPGGVEGIQLMTAGEKRRFWIPAELAFAGNPRAPQGMVVMDIELVSYFTPPAPPKAPKDVAAPPKDAQTTASGLAYKVLKPGSGAGNPKATNVVRVDYSGWTTDGKMFDSSITRGEPAEFGLNQVIPGWTEGLQLMTPGEKRIFWIPEKLAYNGMPGKPKGMLVFEVELLEVVE